MPAELVDGTPGHRRSTCHLTGLRHRRTSHRHTGCRPSGSGASAWLQPPPTPHQQATQPAAVAARAKEELGPGTISLHHHAAFCMHGLLSSPSCPLAAANQQAGGTYVGTSTKESVGAP
jgi:hypothetical protein